MVAFLALLAATAAGTVPAADAFVGFGHPATVTVATVLVISRALSNSGAVELIARHLIPPMPSAWRQVGTMAGVAGALSAVMNAAETLTVAVPEPSALALFFALGLAMLVFLRKRRRWSLAFRDSVAWIVGSYPSAPTRRASNCANA